MATWPTISTYQRWLASTPSLQECSRGGQGTEVGQQPERPHLLVSVITVVLNGADCLARCIQSVLGQGFREKEHIIIDGGSTDGTLEILRDYSDRIDCWISGPDDGIYDAMNKGIVLSRGKYIKLLNADDMLAPDSIAKAVKVFSREENTICIKGNVEVIDKTDQSVEIASTGSFFHPSWYVPRAVYQKAGLYRTDFKISSDYEFFLRLQKMNTEFIHIDEVLVRFRQGGASTGFTGVVEGFRINREYKSATFAARYAFIRFLQKSRLWLLRRLLGDDGLNNLKRRLRGGRGSGKPCS